MKQYAIKNPKGKLIKGSVAETKGDSRLHAMWKDDWLHKTHKKTSNYAQYVASMDNEGYLVVRVDVNEVLTP